MANFAVGGEVSLGRVRAWRSWVIRTPMALTYPPLCVINESISFSQIRSLPQPPQGVWATPARHVQECSAPERRPEKDIVSKT